MKKFMMICLAVTLVLSLSLTALAAPGSFLESPSNNQAPEIVDVTVECDAKVIITPYAKRDTLNETQKATLEDAYDSIRDTQDLTTLSDELKQLAEAQNLKGDKLVVSDLFNIHITDCNAENHKLHHGDVTVKLKADTLEGFVGLMAYVDGKWQMVEGAAVVDGVLTFTIKQFGPQYGPMAIVVKSYVEPPKTGDTGLVYLWAGLVAISAAAVVFCLVKMKKSRAKD